MVVYQAGVGASIRRSWLDQKMKLREVLSMASFLHIMGGAIGQTHESMPFIQCHEVINQI